MQDLKEHNEKRWQECLNYYYDRVDVDLMKNCADILEIIMISTIAELIVKSYVEL